VHDRVEDVDGGGVELAKLDEGIRNIICDVDGRLAIPSLGLDQPGTNRRIRSEAPQVAFRLCVVVHALAAAGVVARDC
jgi:hypothetical protein